MLHVLGHEERENENREGMIEATFLIPLTQNGNGNRHSKKLWDKFHTELCDTFGGFTKECKVYGQWVNGNGEVIKDHSWKYIVAIDSNRTAELESCLSKFKLIFDQETIYLSVNGQVYFI